jgi:hypothetical protein
VRCGFPERSAGRILLREKGCGERDAQALSPPQHGETRGAFCALRFAPSHRISFHLYPMGIVDESVQDAIGQCWIADLFVPS